MASRSWCAANRAPEAVPGQEEGAEHASADRHFLDFWLSLRVYGASSELTEIRRGKPLEHSASAGGMLLMCVDGWAIGVSQEINIFSCVSRHI